MPNQTITPGMLFPFRGKDSTKPSWIFIWILLVQVLSAKPASPDPYSRLKTEQIHAYFMEQLRTRLSPEDFQIIESAIGKLPVLAMNQEIEDFAVRHPGKFADYISASVCIALDKEKSVAFGSGCLLTPEGVGLTCAHLLRSFEHNDIAEATRQTGVPFSGNVNVRTIEEKIALLYLPVQLLPDYEGNSCDWALFRMEGHKPTRGAIPLVDSGTLNPGDFVFLIARADNTLMNSVVNPENGQITLPPGLVLKSGSYLGPQQFPGDGVFAICNTPATHGNSGSGLFNESGLVGLNCASFIAGIKMWPGAERSPVTSFVTSNRLRADLEKVPDLLGRYLNQVLPAWPIPSDPVQARIVSLRNVLFDATADYHLQIQAAIDLVKLSDFSGIKYLTDLNEFQKIAGRETAPLPKIAAISALETLAREGNQDVRTVLEARFYGVKESFRVINYETDPYYRLRTAIALSRCGDARARRFVRRELARGSGIILQYCQRLLQEASQGKPQPLPEQQARDMARELEESGREILAQARGRRTRSRPPADPSARAATREAAPPGPPPPEANPPAAPPTENPPADPFSSPPPAPSAPPPSPPAPPDSRFEGEVANLLVEGHPGFRQILGKTLPVAQRVIDNLRQLRERFQPENVERILAGRRRLELSPAEEEWRRGLDDTGKRIVGNYIGGYLSWKVQQIFWDLAIMMVEGNLSPEAVDAYILTQYDIIVSGEDPLSMMDFMVSSNAVSRTLTRTELDAHRWFVSRHHLEIRRALGQAASYAAVNLFSHTFCRMIPVGAGMFASSVGTILYQQVRAGEWAFLKDRRLGTGEIVRRAGERYALAVEQTDKFSVAVSTIAFVIGETVASAAVYATAAACLASGAAFPPVAALGAFLANPVVSQAIAFGAGMVTSHLAGKLTPLLKERYLPLAPYLRQFGGGNSNGVALASPPMAIIALVKSPPIAMRIAGLERKLSRDYELTAADVVWVMNELEEIVLRHQTYLEFHQARMLALSEKLTAMFTTDLRTTDAFTQELEALAYEKGHAPTVKERLLQLRDAVGYSIYQCVTGCEEIPLAELPEVSRDDLCRVFFLALARHQEYVAANFQETHRQYQDAVADVQRANRQYQHFLDRMGARLEKTSSAAQNPRNRRFLELGLSAGVLATGRALLAAEEELFYQPSPSFAESFDQFTRNMESLKALRQAGSEMERYRDQAQATASARQETRQQDEKQIRTGLAPAPGDTRRFRGRADLFSGAVVFAASGGYYYPGKLKARTRSRDDRDWYVAWLFKSGELIDLADCDLRTPAQAVRGQALAYEVAGSRCRGRVTALGPAQGEPWLNAGGKWVAVKAVRLDFSRALAAEREAAARARLGRQQASQRVRLRLDPPPDNSTWYRGQNQGENALFPGARVFVSWYDGYFYPGALRKGDSWYLQWSQGGTITRDLAGFQVLTVQQAVAKGALVLALSGTPGGSGCYGKAGGVAMAGDKVFLQAAQDDGTRHNVEVDLARLAIGDPEAIKVAMLRTGKNRLTTEERVALGMAPYPGGRTGFRSQDGRDGRDCLFSGATVFISFRDGFWYPAELKNQSGVWRAWWRPGGEGVADLDQCAILSLAGAIARKAEVYATTNGASLGKLVDWYPTRDAKNRPALGLLTSKKTCYLGDVKIKVD